MDEKFMEMLSTQIEISSTFFFISDLALMQLYSSLACASPLENWGSGQTALRDLFHSSRFTRNTLPVYCLMRVGVVYAEVWVWRNVCAKIIVFNVAVCYTRYLNYFDDDVIILLRHMES